LQEKCYRIDYQLPVKFSAFIDRDSNFASFVNELSNQACVLLFFTYLLNLLQLYLFKIIQKSFPYKTLRAVGEKISFFSFAHLLAWSVV
jgi:hypothetical protein